MSKYSWVATPEEIQQSLVPIDLFNFEGYMCAWQSKAEVLQNLLPPPLKLESDIVRIYTTMIHNPSSMPHYREGNLEIECSMGDTKGWFTVSMPVQGPGAEMAAYSGRENLKMAKKIPDRFYIDRMGPAGTVEIERGGTLLYQMKADINGKYNDPAAEAYFKDYGVGNKVNNDSFLLQYQKGAHAGGYGYHSGRMVLGNCWFEMKRWEPATVEITLGETPSDPWAELEVVKVLGGAYCLFDLFIPSAKDLGEVDTLEALRRCYKQRFDVSTFGNQDWEIL